MSNSEGQDAHTWTATFVEEKGWNVPGAARMKRALKVLLRSFGLRCVAIREGGDRGK